jgi:hypothetical protein
MSDTFGAARRTAPGAPTVIAAGTTAGSLGAEQTYITVCAAGGALTLRFGDSTVGAAQTTDWPLAEGEKESFYIGYATKYVSIQGVGALKVVVG